MARIHFRGMAVAASLFASTVFAAQDTGNTQRGTERDRIPTREGIGIRDDRGRDSRLSMLDRRFMVASSLGDMMEIDLSRMALQRGANERLRTFAQRLERDHQRSSQQLSALARDKGVVVATAMMDMEPVRRGGNVDERTTRPDGSAVAGRREETGVPSSAELDRLGLQHMMVEHREVRGLLSGLSGPQFDTAWIGEQVKHHARAVADFEFHARHAADADVRAFANQMLPVLREHYRMSRQLVEQRR